MVKKKVQIILPQCNTRDLPIYYFLSLDVKVLYSAFIYSVTRSPLLFHYVCGKNVLGKKVYKG